MSNRARGLALKGERAAVYGNIQKFPEGHAAFVEQLPGANIQGQTLEELRRNLTEAVELVLETNRMLSKNSDNGFDRQRTLEISGIEIIISNRSHGQICNSLDPNFGPENAGLRPYDRHFFKLTSSTSICYIGPVRTAAWLHTSRPLNGASVPQCIPLGTINL